MIATPRCASLRVLLNSSSPIADREAALSRLLDGDKAGALRLSDDDLAALVAVYVADGPFLFLDEEDQRLQPLQKLPELLVTRAGRALRQVLLTRDPNFWRGEEVGRLRKLDYMLFEHVPEVAYMALVAFSPEKLRLPMDLRLEARLDCIRRDADVVSEMEQAGDLYA